MAFLMLRDQRGFVVPLSMVFSIFMVMYILHMVILYEAEQSTLKERWEELSGDILIQNGVSEVLKESFQIGKLKSGVYRYNEGIVTYHLNPVSKNDIQVTLNIVLETAGVRNVTFQYNSEQGVLTSWME